MKYWWCQTCNLQSTARCEYRNNIFFHVLTKLGTSRYHLLWSAEINNSNTPKWFEKWAYWFWEYLPECTLRIHLWRPTSQPWCDRHQLNAGPTQWQHFEKLCTEQLWTWKWCRRSIMKRSNNGMSETKIFLFTVILHFGLNRNEHNSNARGLYQIFMDDTNCTRLLPEIGHLGSHVSQHLGK